MHFPAYNPNILISILKKVYRLYAPNSIYRANVLMASERPEKIRSSPISDPISKIFSDVFDSDSGTIDQRTRD